ncbi:MAG: 50S ribosomal protein L29 [Desulfosalsimonadaceae bacterium]
MKAKELRNLTGNELSSKLAELVESHFNLRFQQKTGQLENTSRLSQIRREIARVKTIQREKTN